MTRKDKTMDIIRLGNKTKVIPIKQKSNNHTVTILHAWGKKRNGDPWERLVIEPLRDDDGFSYPDDYIDDSDIIVEGWGTIELEGYWDCKPHNEMFDRVL